MEKISGAAEIGWAVLRFSANISGGAEIGWAIFRISANISGGAEIGWAVFRFSVNISGRIEIGWEIFMEIIYNEKICVLCGACATESECGGIIFSGGKILIDNASAEDWASIAEICPVGALTIKNPPQTGGSKKC